MNELAGAKVRKSEAPSNTTKTQAKTHTHTLTHWWHCLTSNSLKKTENGSSSSSRQKVSQLMRCFLSLLFHHHHILPLFAQGAIWRQNFFWSCFLCPTSTVLVCVRVCVGTTITSFRRAAAAAASTKRPADCLFLCLLGPHTVFLHPTHTHSNHRCFFWCTLLCPTQPLPCRSSALASLSLSHSLPAIANFNLLINI